MIDPITPITIISNYTRTTDKETEIHKFISVNNNSPKHFINYILYNSKGIIEENYENKIDINT